MKSGNTSSISISSLAQRRKLFFITFLTFTVLILSCKKESDIIGLELQPESEILNAVFTDSTTLITYPIREDSVRSDGRVMPFNNLLGSYTDPVFGMTKASFYSQFRLTSSNVSFDQVQLDSIVLSLAYAGYYGDTSTAQTISIYKMTEPIHSDTNYYSNSEFTIDNNPVGTITFLPRPNTDVQLVDTSLGPHIRITLDNSFGNEILNAGSGNLINNEAWLQFLPGLYISAEEVLSNGAILYINYASALTRLSLFYSDTAQQHVYDFRITAQAARVNSYKHDYSSMISFNDTVQGGITTYVQSMGGVKTKVIFPHLKELSKSGPIAINKAELIIQVESGSDGTYAPHDRLTLFASDSSGKNVVLPDQIASVTSGFFGGEYNSGTKEYKFNIPRYAQQLVNENRENYGLFLLASGAASNANRSIVGGGSNPGPSKMKLKITYTRIQ
jgi:hypothetical protein